MFGEAGRTLLHVSTFRGLQNLPLYVAMRRQYFAAQGLDIDISYTSGSAMQIAGLAHGEYELIQTAPDNVMCANSTPALFGLDVIPDIVMLLGGSVGPLSVFAQPQFTTPAALRGVILGVDNPDSGFALVLRDVLAHNLLELNHDYTFTVSGGTSARLAALTGGRVGATILYAPYDVMAEAAGMRRLAVSTEYYPAYASLATAARREWVDTHQSEVIRYITALLQSLHWIYEPRNAAEVQALLRDEATLGLDASVAAEAYAAFVASGIGFGETAQLDDVGLHQVEALRRRYGTLTEPLDIAGAYCDLRWYEQARTAGA